ncbi:MAG: glycosyltransferase family 4 protein, partial [Thermoplasmatota archaeon]
MTTMNLCVHTQTPFARFFSDDTCTAEPLDLGHYVEDVDYQRSPGGVTRMVAGLLEGTSGGRRFDHATWMSLATRGPDAVRLNPRVDLDFVRLPPALLRLYSRSKSLVWDAIHGLAHPLAFATTFAVESSRLQFSELARAFGRETQRRHEERPFDAFYSHDFQLLPIARFVPARVPKIFRWHVPVPEGRSAVMDYTVERLNRFDAVVVSTRAYAERMRLAGVTVPVYASYPYIDESLRRLPTREAIRAFEDRVGIDERHEVFVLIARTDPVKSHDVAVRALARIRREAPNARLVCVGGGGFSGGKRASLGLPQAEAWQKEVARLARELDVADRVVLTGNVDEEMLDAAYARSRAVLLPSRLEGFGLSIVEGWVHERPALVSQ